MIKERIIVMSKFFIIVSWSFRGLNSGGRRIVQPRCHESFQPQNLSTLRKMVREEGIEPSNPYGYRILSPVRLPISPLPQPCRSSTYRPCCNRHPADVVKSVVK